MILNMKFLCVYHQANGQNLHFSRHCTNGTYNFFQQFPHKNVYYFIFLAQFRTSKAFLSFLKLLKLIFFYIA